MLNRQAFIGQDGRALPQMTCVESTQARTGMAGVLPSFLKPEGTFAANSEARDDMHECRLLWYYAASFGFLVFLALSIYAAPTRMSSTS